MKNYRNICCPFYGKCLDEAIEQNKTGFSCAGCENESLFEEILYENEKIIIQNDLNPTSGIYWLLCEIFKTFEGEYQKGPEERLDSFAEYAYKVLPENIANKAIPSEATLKRLDIPREPKNKAKQADITHVNTLGPAYIRADWQFCGDNDLSKFLGRSVSWIEKGKKEGWLAYNVWNGYSWYAQSSADFLKEKIKTGEIKNYARSWRGKIFWTDQS